jgi:hypothetical protein
LRKENEPGTLVYLEKKNDKPEGLTNSSVENP